MPQRKHKPEEIVAKLRQVDVLVSHTVDPADHRGAARRRQPAADARRVARRRRDQGGRRAARPRARRGADRGERRLSRPGAEHVSGAMPTTGAASCCGSRRPVSTPSASRPAAPRWRPWRQETAPPAAEGRGRRPPGPAGATSARSGKTREGTKQALLVGMLGRAEGATIAEIVAATGWQPHTVRGALRRRAEEATRADIESAKVEGRGRVYRIVG